MKLIFRKTFIKDIKKIKDPKVARKIEQIIIELKEVEFLEELPNFKKMKGYSIAYRIRVGDYRMGIYKISKDELEIIRFLKREDIYKVFP